MWVVYKQSYIISLPISHTSFIQVIKTSNIGLEIKDV